MSTSAVIQPHNERPAAVWSSGGTKYDQVSRGIANSIEHCVLRLDPKPGERILDLATGTGWTLRLVAKRGATVIGADIAADLVAAARERAKAEGLDIEYRIGDAEKLPFADAEFDAVISTCGMMFASRPEAAAAESRARDPARVDAWHSQRGYPFTLGVASGQPSPKGFVLWTRLAPVPLAPDGLGGVSGPASVRWEVAADETMRTSFAPE